MSVDTSTPVVESKWADALEYAVFGLPAMVGVACLFALYSFGGSFTGTNPLVRLVAVLWIVSFVGGFVLNTLMAVSVYFDAKKVRDADVSWDPSPVLYGVATFFLSGLVALHYLYNRYEYTDASSTWESWWYGVAACLAVVVVAVAVSLAPISTGLGVLGFVFASAGVLPIVIYKDAVHVRGTDSDWLPNPVNYFLGVLFGSILLVVPAVVSGYYLYKRHKHVGVP